MMRKLAASFVALLVAAVPLLNVVTASAALATNPIANPSMETASGAAPANWANNAWGSTAAFEYVDGAAQNGSKSVKVTVSALNATEPGDAKWYATPVAIPAGATYTYTDYYKSDVATRVVAAYMDATGAILSYGDLADAPAAANWTKYSGDFTMVTGATTVSIYHLIDKVGYLQLDNVAISDAIVLPPSSGELDIPNPSVETSSNTATPLGWQASGWGTNNRTFEYVNEGHNSTKSVKVTMSGYTDGDAKWYFNPITTLKADAQYRATMWYKASAGVQPKAVVMYTNAAGTQSFFGMPTPTSQLGQDAATTWQPYNATFSVPQGAVSVSFFMYINQNGWIQTDDFSLANYAPTGFTEPMYTLTFDDGHEDNNTLALDKMKSYGFKSTQCYATTFIEDVANQPEVLAGIKKFTDAGHEICSHTDTHPDLTTRTDAELKFELEHPKQYLTNMLTTLGVPASQQTQVPNFASPYGAYDARVNAAIKAAGYQTHRTVNEGYNSIDNFNAYELKVQNMLDTTTLEQFKSWVDQAKKDNTWLIFVYHRVAENPGPYDTKTADFMAQMDYLKSQNIMPKTFQEAFVSAKAQAEGTTNPGDTTAPSISGVATTNLTSNSVRIDWKANEFATHTFKYGTSATAGYDKTATVQITGGGDADLTTSRYVELTNLTPNTTYFFQITATDNAGNIGETATSFKTAAAPATAPVVNAAVDASAEPPYIVWGVNKTIASAVVEYGTTTAYGTNASYSVFGTNEYITSLNGLAANTKYYYRITATDSAGLTGTKTGEFTTPASTGTDVTPPVILAANLFMVTATGATLSATTDDAVTATLEYGTSTAYGSTAAVVTGPVSPLSTSMGHNAQLTGLQSNTKYYLRFTVSDAAGNKTVKELTFTTLAGAGQTDVTPPTFTDAPKVSKDIGGTAIHIGWQTDEPTTGKVEYGTTTAYGNEAAVQTYNTSYTSYMELALNTPYYFRITATDAAGNKTVYLMTYTLTFSDQPGDVNGDGSVDALDLSLVLMNWDLAGATRLQGDMNGDSTVDALDLSIVLTNWSMK